VRTRGRRAALSSATATTPSIIELIMWAMSPPATDQKGNEP
jgi:hypothetical protein